MYGLKGLLVESDSEEAEKSFRTSIEIARRQSAKSLELGATTRLAGLLARQGRRDEGGSSLRKSTAGSPKVSIHITSKWRRLGSTN